MIVKYAGDILADVNKVYVIYHHWSGCTVTYIPCLMWYLRIFFTTFTSPLLDTSCRHCFLNIDFQIHHLPRCVFL